MDDEFINPIGPVSKKRRNTSYVAKHNDEVSKIEAHEEHTLHLPDSTDQVLGENNAVYLHDQVNEQQIIKNPAEVPSMIAHQAQVFGDNIISSTSNALYMKNKGPNEAIEATAGVTTIGQSREILKSWFSQESDLCLQKTELLPQGDQEILSFNDLLHVLNQIQRYQQLEESNVDKKLSLSFAVKGAGNNIIYVLHELTTIVLANIYLLKNKRNEAKQEMNEELAQKKSKPLSHRSKNSIIKKYETKMFHADKTFDENLGLLKQEALLNFINFFNTIKMLLRDDTLPPSQEKVSKLDESEEPFRWSSVINRLRDTLNNFIEKIRKSEKKILSHKKI